MNDYTELVARLREQADDVLDPGYPFYGTPELVREAADALEEQGRELEEMRSCPACGLQYTGIAAESTRAQLAEAERERDSFIAMAMTREDALHSRLAEAEALLWEALARGHFSGSIHGVPDLPERIRTFLNREKP